MKPASLLAASLLVSACATFRPSPPEVVPDAYRPDGTPVREDAPPAPIREIVRSPSDIRASAHFAFFVDAQPANLQASEGVFALPERAPTLVSVDAVVQKVQGIGPGFAVKVIKGHGKVPEFAEGAILVGTRQLSADLGIATRAGPNIFRGGAYDSTYALLRFGARSRINLGGTGLSVHLRGAKYLGMPETGTRENEIFGWSTESGLTWTWSPVPISLNLGYRYELFRVRDRRQELSAFTLGTGIIFGRR